MPVCINEARPGGKIRYKWVDGKGGGFYLTGEFIELTPFSRIVHVERMHLPDPTPDNQVETSFDPDGTGTLMTMRMTLPDAETRALMLATGMEHGMEQSYVRLEGLAVKIALAPTIIETKAQHTAVIRLSIPRAEMMKAFGPAIEELVAVPIAQGTPPQGSAFAHHLKMSSGIFDFEMGFITAAPVTPAGLVEPGHGPASKAVQAVYQGSYDGLPAAWGEFNAWIKANGIAPAQDLWEHYVIGPHLSPDPTAWRTELYRPING